MDLYLFALLPLGLASFFSRRLPRSTAGFGFLAALAPVLAKGIGSLISHKQNKSKEKQAQEQAKLEAQQQDALARQQWESQQNSPAAQAARFKNTLQLGRLAGAMGGSLDKLPPSIRNYYQSMRTMPEYSGVSSYVPTAQKGGGGWDFAAGLTDALSYLDTSKLGKGTPKINPSLQAAGNAAASRGGMGALQGGGPATSIIGDYIARQKTQAPAQVALSSGQQITPFDPKFGRG